MMISGFDDLINSDSRKKPPICFIKIELKSTKSAFYNPDSVSSPTFNDIHFYDFIKTLN